jgi:hypothetical protein
MEVEDFLDTTAEHGISSAKAVESEAEFNTLLPQLAIAMQSNRHEWEYYYTMQGLVEIMNGNQHMLFYVGHMYNVQAFAFFQVDRYPTGEAQIDLIWSWAKDELQEEAIADAASALACANGARRMRANSCRPLARKLMKLGYSARNLEMIKDM